MKKAAALLLACLFCVMAFASCAGQTTTEVSIKVIGYQEELIYDGSVTVIGEGPTVADALYALETNKSISSLDMKNNKIQSINDTETQPDGSGKYYFYWRYTLNGHTEDETVNVNGEESSVYLGITQQPISAGDTIIIEYVHIAIADLEG